MCTWFLALREEDKLKMFENRQLRRMDLREGK
jgi:hypothetical protein